MSLSLEKPSFESRLSRVEGDYDAIPRFGKYVDFLFTKSYPFTRVPSRKESTMSIAVCLRSQQGIVLVTDSRRTSQVPDGSGRTHSDDVAKLWAVEKTIGIAAVGNMIDYASQLVESFDKQTGKSEAFDQLVNEFLLHMREDWAKAMRTGIPELLPLSGYVIEFILAGYQGNTPKIKRIGWDVKQSAIVIENIDRDNYVTGSWTIAEYWIKKIKENLPSMQIQELKNLASFLVMESTYYDGVGCPIQMIAIEKDKGLQIVDSEESNRLKEAAIKTMEEGANLIINRLM